METRPAPGAVPRRTAAPPPAAAAPGPPAPRRPSDRPTMRDVAEYAGVGLGTVSRVVNNAGAVSPDTAARVRAAIEAIGFRRNELARSLRPGQTSRTLGLLLGDLTNPYYASLAKAAGEIARAAGYAVLLSTADEDAEAESRAIGELLGRRVAGLIVVPGQSDHSYLARGMTDEQVPVVFIDRPATGITADVVLLDNEGGGHRATRHLVDHGHRRIAVLVAPSYHATGRRLRGYRRALREAGLPGEERLVVRLRRGTVDEARAAAHRLLVSAEPPTGFFATTGFLTEGVLRAAHGLGMRVPPALVGFDDLRLADLLPVPVTVVSSDTEELGRHATRLLLDRVAGAGVAPRRTVLPVHLVVRGSGEIRTGTARNGPPQGRGELRG